MDADAKCVESVMVLVTVVLVLVRVSAAGTTRTCQSAVPRWMPAGAAAAVSLHGTVSLPANTAEPLAAAE